jgi:hypothetical protein
VAQVVFCIGTDRRFCSVKRDAYSVAGSDISNGSMTNAEALVPSNALGACVGHTYNGSLGGPSFDVHLKSSTSSSTDSRVGWIAAFKASNPVCVISRIYDQRSQQNHLGVAPKGGKSATGDMPASASALPVTVGGQKV